MAPALAVVELVLPPRWAQLPADKQQILAPLSTEWDHLEAARKKKWLDIAERYPRMGKEEQERVQRRMKTWAKLSPDERRQAREKYKQIKQASPEEREALKKKWSEYQALPDEEKKRLKQSAAGKAVKRDPPTGAGQATRPASSTRPSLIPQFKQPAPSTATPGSQRAPQ